MSEKFSCKFCIHLKTCNARTNYDSIREEWDRQFPYVKMNSDGDSLASVCTEYKTLSDVHLSTKDETFSQTETQEVGEPSVILKRVINALDKLDQMSLNPEQYTKEEYTELHRQTNDLAKKLSDEEWEYAQNYASHARGLNQ